MLKIRGKLFDSLELGDFEKGIIYVYSFLFENMLDQSFMNMTKATSRKTCNNKIRVINGIHRLSIISFNSIPKPPSKYCKKDVLEITQCV